MRIAIVGLLALSMCGGGDPARPVAVLVDASAPAPATCGALPLQNTRAFARGDTLYLNACGAWQVEASPSGSTAKVFPTGAPRPRFTPDVAGEYVLRNGEERLPVRVVIVPQAERFQNHHLNPLYGMALVEPDHSAGR